MFRELELKKVYDSENDDLIKSFYIPALKQAVLYKRTTAFFSSAVFVVAFEGIRSFIENGGKMQLITGIYVDEQDFQAIKNGIENKNLLNYLEKEIESASIENIDRLKILSWMISQQVLTIKIAVFPKSSAGIFHEKIGIFIDSVNDKISFSGSANETAGGWKNNHEEFKLFRSWDDSEREWQVHDENKFDKYWIGEVNRFSVIPLPLAIEKEILKVKPNNDELKEIFDKIFDDEVEIDKLERDNLSKKELRDYQKEAVSNWVGNKYRGIFQMATGTGKTITAIGCVEHTLKDKGRNFVIIAAPQKHLIEQWRKDLEIELPSFSIRKCDGDNHNWRKDLNEKLFNYKYGIEKQIIILTTYVTLSSEDFIKIFKNKYDPSKDYLFIADEMHNSGAEKSSNCLLEEFNLRLGLSATPKRYFDESGTEMIYAYFGDVVYEYTIERAINEGMLTRYNYYPSLVHLNEEEYERYLKITKQMMNFQGKEVEKGEILKRLMMRRAQITKKTEEKYFEFRNILEELVRQRKEDYLLIYCQDGEQLLEAQKIVNEIGIISHKLTEKENTVTREKLLKEFGEGGYKCLIAMNCLVEGIDVPATRTAIIMASTGNPRQYVQRRGRVLRKFEGKTKAYIYDFIVIPPSSLSSRLISEIERSIIRKELERVSDFLETADNKLEVINKLSNTMLDYGVYIE